MAITKNISKHNSLVILDWDNTLFPTTWVTSNFINLNNEEVRNRHLDFFSDLDEQLFKLLKKIMIYSKVIIITNALPIWIKISSGVFPKTRYLLNYIKVVSARKNFQNKSKDATEWKKMAFHTEVEKEINTPNIENIISIGDALYEYQALINLYNKKRILKSIKFLDEPTHEILKDQLEVINKNIIEIIKSPKHMDLVFTLS